MENKEWSYIAITIGSPNKVEGNPDNLVLKGDYKVDKDVVETYDELIDEYFKGLEQLTKRNGALTKKLKNVYNELALYKNNSQYNKITDEIDNLIDYYTDQVGVLQFNSDVDSKNRFTVLNNILIVLKYLRKGNYDQLNMNSLNDIMLPYIKNYTTVKGSFAKN